METTEAPMEVASPPVADCNDYSRFNEIEDSDDEEMPAKADDAPAAVELLSASSCMQRCTELKELGNACFKSGDTAGSRVHYAEGTDLLTKHATVLLAANLKEDGDKLLAALHGNMAMAYLKEENFSKTIEAASSVLGLEASNVKALYRRGLSYSKTGFFPEGKTDLSRCLEIEPSNAAARTALSDLSKTQRAHDAAEKRAFGKMFEGPSMYGDREKELADKQRRVLEREEMLQDEWSKSKLEKRRVADAGAEDQTFDDFKVEYEKKEKEVREEAERLKKKKSDEDMAASSVGRDNKPSRPISKPESDDEDDEDLKDVRGYKTTSDGRKTTFFNKELDASTKQLIGDITPKAIGAGAAAAGAGAGAAAGGGASPTSPASSVATALDNGASGIEASSWNKAGTWEERDMTAFVTERLKALCTEAVCETSADEPTALQLRGRVKSCKKAEGEAQIILARGKKRHVYDFNVTLDFEINVDSIPAAPSPPSDIAPAAEGDVASAVVSSPSSAAPGISKTIKGTLELHDLSAASSASGYEAEVRFAKALPAGLAGCIQRCSEALREDVCARLSRFESEYKAL